MPSSPEATASIDLGGAAVGPVYPQPQEAGGNKAGLFGWFSGSTFMNKVVEKTKVGALQTFRAKSDIFTLIEVCPLLQDSKMLFDQS